MFYAGSRDGRGCAARVVETLRRVRRRRTRRGGGAAVAPQHRDMTIEVIAPQGFVFADLPPDGEEDGGEFGKASLSLVLSPDKRRVTVKRTVALSRSRIAVAEYPRWRAWLQRVDGVLQRSVRLLPR